MRNAVSGSSFLAIILAGALLAPNCATMSRKPEQRIPVTSSPAGATVFVNGMREGITPVEISLPRKIKNRVIRIESAGYDPVEIRLKRSLSADNVFGNIFLGGAGGALNGLFYGWIASAPDNLLGWIAAAGAAAGIVVAELVDMSRSGYTLHPTELEVTLKKTDGTPRVDTIFVKADELRNVKWIRVRKD